MYSKTQVYLELLAVFPIFLLIIFTLPDNLSWPLRSTIGITGASVWLWVLEPIPLALTSLLVIAALPILNATSLDTALSGFSNGSTFLIMAGFMMSQGVNSTTLGKRFANYSIIRFGGSIYGVLLGVLLAPQILSFFIPGTAVRTTLLLPAVMAVIISMKLSLSSNIAKLLILGLTFGASISGVGLLPAALANVLTADLIKNILGQDIYYFTWFMITWPIWLFMIPITWLILPTLFPPETKYLEVNQLRTELKELGKLSSQDKKCLIILAVTVVLWMTESFHKLPTAVPAILATVFMGLPGIGIVGWDKLKEIEWGTIIMIGASLSMASALNNSGAADFLAGELLSFQGLQTGLSTPLLLVFLLILLTHFYHLVVTNISTVVLTLTPIMLQIALKLGVNPLLVAITINIATLFGFLLIVQTLPSVVTYTTGVYTSMDMLRAGFWLTIASLVVMIITAQVWWPFIGLN
ncbi:SLC13 family permease [Desulfosporosinus nitroreducens]|uniref:SLC13 family permease n=1 Tax=Desulfosporosinus nitroreducens TaxID=2018668 RepID=UPI00207C62A9|nr:DASS family sodium-coupled anion symporter [Desulfosporosinus nitroreducens]MCO1604525.1 DASS family sodium-coupled anion symporter [Desulfosporosinus nitroreducens]